MINGRFDCPWDFSLPIQILKSMQIKNPTRRSGVKSLIFIAPLNGLEPPTQKQR